MTLSRFLGRAEGPDRSLVVVNRSAPQPIQALLEKAFDGQPVAVTERELPDTDADLVVLLEDDGDGERTVVATSPLSKLSETVLLVNSDLYRTGAVELEKFELPDVLAQLDEVPFRLRGYPESNKEKLLLIVISRYIERRAWQAGGGRLRSSFQRLSRISDERGTRAVYETLAESETQVHVYGIPDWKPPVEFDVRSHGGYAEDHRDSWFVVYTPPPVADRLPAANGGGNGGEWPNPAALLALEVEPRTWEGYWTFDPDLVTDLEGHIAHNL